LSQIISGHKERAVIIKAIPGIAVDVIGQQGHISLFKAIEQVASGNNIVDKFVFFSIYGFCQEAIGSQ